jgi:hypothetical protein
MTLISIFNGHQRALGEESAETGHRVFIQIDVRFLEALHQFHGAALSVLMALALRSNERGWSWPSIETLQNDTGLSRNSIFRALEYLCSQRINGRRVLLRARLRNPDGTLGTNCYLLFPTPAEEEEYNNAVLLEYPEDAPTKYQKVVLGNHVPSTTFTNVVKLHPNNNHDLEPEPEEEEEEEEKKAEKEKTQDNTHEIQQALEEHGVFRNAAQEIAALMSSAGLSAADAVRILAATVQSIQSGMPRGDEEVMSLAVDRLRRGCWDAGERARRTIRQARYSGGVPAPSPPSPSVVDRSPPPGNSDAAEIWEQVLEELQLELTRATFETWLRPTRAVGRDNGVLVIQVASVYARDWLEGRLRGMVERAVERVAGEPLKVQFVVEGVPCPSP